eukprot:SAG11_NODE_1876_length_4137_cov_1.429916_2_plen_64_part_00
MTTDREELLKIQDLLSNIYVDPHVFDERLASQGLQLQSRGVAAQAGQCCSAVGAKGAQVGGCR